jgi:ribosomal protein S18 acetylase RimI-like enzyme
MTGTDATIRKALPGEAARLRDVVRAAYAHYVPLIGRPPAPMQDDYDRRIAQGEAWMLDRAGRIEGVLVLEAQPGVLLLDNVAVRPDRQGQGYGRRLIAFAEHEARSRGCQAVRLYTNVRMEANIRLYARLGFVETGRAAQDGFDRVFMEKQVGSPQPD